MSQTMNKKWMFSLAVCSLCIFLLVNFFHTSLFSPVYTVRSLFSNFPTTSSANQTAPGFVESRPSSSPPHHVPRLAYSVSGSKGDLDCLWRTLRALYHPHNIYIVHLDLESPLSERSELASCVKNDRIFAKVGNVHVIVEANMVTYRGPTMISNTLHACAILLKKSRDWDWFINLSASDYPLMTQDDILSVFSTLPRNLNFVEHTSQLEWKEEQRAKPLIIDPGLYRSTKSDIFLATENRELPTAFKIYTGSAWMALSREFIEYTVLGWDNLPRTLLMYYANFVSSSESYFHTVICNAPNFKPTVANHDLHYIAWDSPPDQHPHTLTSADMPSMIGSNAPFARKFDRNDPVLDRIDADLLGWKNGSFVPGGWCAGSPKCSEIGNSTRLEPGRGARRLVRLMDWIVRSRTFDEKSCR